MFSHPESLEAYNKEKKTHDTFTSNNYFLIISCLSIAFFLSMVNSQINHSHIILKLFLLLLIDSPLIISIFLATCIHLSNVRFKDYTTLTLKDFPAEWKLLHYLSDKDEVVGAWLKSWKKSEVGILLGDVKIVKKYIEDYHQND